ncbi:MAG: hypothetical protein HKO53_06940 [Gemmatimonadetes bacterium]|nr:hypothetical protein [Gemmatimonadota bacterium]
MDPLIADLTNESRWIFPSVLLALTASLAVGRTTAWDRGRIAGAMTMFSGLLIGLLALGHLFAVLLKQAVGTLSGAVVPLYAIGLVLVVPAALVVREGWGLVGRKREPGRKTAVLHGLLALALVLTGPLNLPLAVPSLLSGSYALQRRRAVGLTIVAAMLLVVALLLLGSARFFASGQSFEDFSA